MSGHGEIDMYVMKNGRMEPLGPVEQWLADFIVDQIEFRDPLECKSGDVFIPDLGGDNYYGCSIEKNKFR